MATLDDPLGIESKAADDPLNVERRDDPLGIDAAARVSSLEPKLSFTGDQRPAVPSGSADQGSIVKSLLNLPQVPDVTDAGMRARMGDKAFEAAREDDPLRILGAGFNREGRMITGALADLGTATYGRVLSGSPPPDESPVRNLKAAVLDQPMPFEREEKNLSPTLRIAGAADKGLIETLPQMAATMAAPEMTPIIWGTTPEGFSPKQAVLAVALPVVGKYSGAITESIAAKLGVSNDTAKLVLNKLGGATGATGLLSADQAAQIMALPPDQRKDAIIDGVGNVGSMFVLGIMGDRHQFGKVSDDAALQAIKNSLPEGFVPKQAFVSPQATTLASRPVVPETGTTVPTKPIPPPDGVVRTPDGAVDLVQTAINKLTAKPAAVQHPVIEKLDNLVSAVQDLKTSLTNPFKTSQVEPSESRPPGTTETVETSQPAPAVATPAGPVASSGYAPSDLARYDELVGRMRGATLDQAQPIATELNALKNRYGGKTPDELAGLKKIPPPIESDTTGTSVKTDADIATDVNRVRRQALSSLKQVKTYPQWLDVQNYLTDTREAVTGNKAMDAREREQLLGMFEELFLQHHADHPEFVKIFDQGAEAGLTEKKTTAGTETDADNSQQSESNLPNGRSGDTVPEPPAAVKPRRVGRGHTSGKVFDRETELGGPDILSWIRDEMPMMSKSAAQKSRGAEWWQRNKSLYDDSAPLSRPHHNKIYGGKSSPDQVAQAAHREGLLKSPDTADLWESIKTASQRRRGVFEQQRQTEKMLEDQAEWHKATTKGELRVRGEDLEPGDTFEVDGERFVVKRVDKATGDVELQDGKKYGRQTLQRGMSIWIEKPDESISDRVAEKAGSDWEGSPSDKPVEFAPPEDPAATFKVGDKVLHEGQIKTVTKAVPGSDFVGVGKRAIHVKELKLATVKDKAEVVAKKLEKLKSGIKGGKGGQLHAFGLAADLWDRAVSIAQSVIRAGGSIADAITAAIKHIRENHQGEFDEQGARAKLNESVRDEALEHPANHVDEAAEMVQEEVPPDRERSVAEVKGDLVDSEAKLKDRTRDLVNRKEISKKERQQAMYREAARYRNLRDELLHHPDYIAEQLATQNAAITEANAILKPHGQAVRPDDFPNLEKLRDVLSPEQFKRLQELSQQIEVSHGELVRMPKKMVTRVYGEMQDDGRLPKSAPANPDTGRSLDNVTSWLRANGVDSPRKTLADRLNLGARITEALHTAKTAAQKALLTAQGIGKAAWESYKSPPKDDDFRTVIKQWIYADQRTGRANQDFVNEIVRQVPHADRRKAMAIWLDADGDATLLKFQLESVPDAYRKPWELAIKLTDGEKQLAMKIKQDFADKLDAGQNAGILDQGRADYGVPQRWKLKPETEGDPIGDRRKGAPGNPFAKLDSRSPFFSFQRETPSYFDGIMSKGVPENLDIAHLVSTYDRAFHKSLSSRGMVAALQEAKAKDGLPVVKISGIANMVKGEEGNTYFVDSKAWNKSDVSVDGRPYRSLDHSALKGWKLAFKDAEGNPIVVKGDMLIHPDHFLYLKNELGQSAFREGDVGKVLNPVFQSQAFLKASKLSGSAFHLMTIGEHMASHLVNPFTGGFKIDLRQPDQSLLVRNGLIASLDHARMAYEEGLMSGHGGLFNKIPGLGDLSAKLTDWMFNEYIPTIMMKTGLKMLESNRARYSKDTWEGKKLTDDQIAELTANQMNAAGGLLNKRIGGADGNIFGRLGSNKTMMDLQRMVLMAPQFLEARMRVVGQALKPYGHQQRKLLIVQAAVMYAGARILNELLDGDPHWDDNPFSVVYHGRAYSIRTIVGDFYHLLTDPASFAAGRLSPLAKIAMEDVAMGGRDLRTGARKDVLIETQHPIGRMAQNIVMDIANWLTPIPVEGLLPGAAGKDQSVGGMALSSIGVGSRKFTAAGEMYKLAADFNRTSADAKANNWQAKRDNSSFGHSDYAKLDALLDAGKLDAAKSEYRALLGEGKTSGMISARYSRQTYFTGSAAREEQFVSTLSPKQREIYQKAKAEQAARGDALQQMLNAAGSP